MSTSYLDKQFGRKCGIKILHATVRNGCSEWNDIL